MEHPNPRGGANHVNGYSPLQLLFLLRLNRLLRLKRQYGTMPHTEKYLIEMLNKAMYSTFLDCQELGIGPDAREMIAKNQAEPR
jgi:hypothetical protein